MTLRGTVALVTGASKGIGRAAALALAGEGARVAAVARSAGLLEKLAEEAAGEAGEIWALPADVTRPEQVSDAVAAVLARWGRVDLLVNNAGVEKPQPVDEVTDADYDLTLDTNLRGVFLFTRAVLPAMKAQRAGQIINIASSAGLRGFGGDAVYCAAKFGVIGFTEALNEEVRPFGIRACAIAPGAVNTELAKETWSPADDPYRTYFLQPEDLARAILFVAGQPQHVAAELIVLRPTVEPAYSPFLPIES